MNQCTWCHGHFKDDELILRPDGRICLYCQDEIDMGIRREPDCPECLEPVSACLCEKLSGY